MSHRLRLHWYSLCMSVLCTVVLSSCNDAPSIIGSEVIDPTDSAFASTLSKVTSDSLPMFVGDSTLTERILLPLRSSIAGPVLLGSTPTSEARVLLSFATDEFALLATDTVDWDSYITKVDTTINGKDTTIDKVNKVRKPLRDAIAQDSIFISLAQLRVNGDAAPYRFGDTTDNSVSFGVYELLKNFSAFATWDSVYDATGNSLLYSPFTVPLGQYVNTPLMPSLDESLSDPNSAYKPDIYTYNESGIPLARIAMDKSYIRRMFKLGIDSAGRDKIYGLVLHPTGMKSITRFDGTITLQVNFRKLGSDNLPWIRRFALTCFNMVQTPSAPADEAVIQGARKHSARVLVNLDAIDSTAIIFDGELSFPIDKDRSQFGTNIQDQGVVVYSPLENADTVVFAARITPDRSKIVVSNFGQRFRRIESQTVSVGTLSMGRFLEEYVQKPGRKHPIYVGSQTNTRIDRIHLMKSTNPIGQRPFLRVYYSRQKATS